MMDMNAEAEPATELLERKAVTRVARHHEAEAMVEFVDGTHLYVDRSADGSVLSIKGGGKG
jgi:hypothetical protein